MKPGFQTSDGVFFEDAVAAEHHELELLVVENLKNELAWQGNDAAEFIDFIERHRNLVLKILQGGALWGVPFSKKYSLMVLVVSATTREEAESRAKERAGDWTLDDVNETQCLKDGSKFFIQE